MRENFREYQSIKFFRGYKRKHDEMQRLADAGLDFDYRRLLIQENELDLHVSISKMLVYKWLSWCFIAIAFICLQLPILALVFFGLAVLSCFLSFINKRFFQFVLRGHNLSLSIVDIFIKQEYGISFQ